MSGHSPGRLQRVSIAAIGVPTTVAMVASGQADIQRGMGSLYRQRPGPEQKQPPPPVITLTAIAEPPSSGLRAGRWGLSRARMTFDQASVKPVYRQLARVPIIQAAAAAPPLHDQAHPGLLIAAGPRSAPGAAERFPRPETLTGRPRLPVLPHDHSRGHACQWVKLPPKLPLQ